MNHLAKIPALALGLLALVVPMAAPTPGACQPTGGTEGNLALGAGSRGIALGGAFLARVDDASAVHWNPASLAALERGDLTLMHAPIGFGDATLTFFGVGFPTLRAGTFGFGILRLATQDIQAYDADSHPLGEIRFAETAAYFSYAYKPRLPFLGRRLAVGASAKTVTQSLTPWSTTGAGLDLGLVYTSRMVRGLDVALVCKDALAPRLRLADSSDAVPLTWQIATSYSVLLRPDLGVGLHVGFDRQRYLGLSPRLGVELHYKGRITLRFGGSREGAAFGIGIGWNRYGFDYAHLSRMQATTQPVSLRTAWGTSVPDRLAAVRIAREAERQAQLRAHLQSMVEDHLTNAQGAYERGDYGTALDQWKLAAGIDPADERAAKGMQSAAARLAELQSRKLFDETEAAQRAAQFELGLRYYGSSEYVLARNVWRELLHQDPENLEARRYLEKTEEGLRDQVRHHAERARVLEAHEDHVSALVEWHQVRSADPLHPEAERGLARCRAALERAPQNRPVHRAFDAARSRYHEALDLYSSGDLENATEVLREVTRIDPENQAADRLLSQAERQMGPLDQTDLERVRELYLRGMGHFAAKEFEKAIEEWSRILELDPGNASVYRNIDEARMRLEAIRNPGTSTR